MFALRIKHALSIEGTMLGISLGAIAVTVAAWIPQFRLNRNITLSIGIFLFVFGNWWAPGISQSFHTMSSILFEPWVAKNYPGAHLSGFIETFSFFINTSGKGHILASLFLGVSALFVYSIQRRETVHSGSFLIILFGLLAFFIPALATMLSHAGDPRRVYAGVYLFGVGTAALGVTSSIGLASIRGGI